MPMLTCLLEFLRKPPQTQNGHPEGRPLSAALSEERLYRSLFRQLIRSPRVVVELETGALWLSFL
jgi:hypothetical protein